MKAATIMIQGTASSVGKSLITTALCRLYRRRGYRVAPFKAQNMALNSAVTWEGHEIGRAQAAQAEACGMRPSSLMNPVLLKPEGERRSQVIVRGKSWGSMQACEYHRIKPELRGLILESLEELRSQVDLVVIEGAGSPAEINLKDHDIVNMFVARALGSPVLLVGDIDRGGVFAALVGTMELLTPEERALVAGFVINKFRGDPALLGGGLDFLLQKTGVPTLGIVPYMRDHRLAEEDSLSLADVPRRWTKGTGTPRVALVQLPRISNFDEWSPLVRCPALDVIFTTDPRALVAADLVIIPGTKNTVEDLAWLREQGLAQALLQRVASGQDRTHGPGRWVLAICGGCQLLGYGIDDREGVETTGLQVKGLGILPVATVFRPTKRTVQSAIRPTAHTREGGDSKKAASGGAWSWLHEVLWGDHPCAGESVPGYEIHAGQTFLADGSHDEHWGLFELETLSPTQVIRQMDGVKSPCGQVVGTMVHGLFENPGMPLRLARWLHCASGNAAGQGTGTVTYGVNGVDQDCPEDSLPKDLVYDGLAAHLEKHLDVEALDRMIFGPKSL